MLFSPSPAPILYPAFTNSCLRWLQQAPVCSTKMHFLSCFLRTSLKQGSDLSNPFGSCQMANQLKSTYFNMIYNRNPQGLISVCQLSSSPATFSLHCVSSESLAAVCRIDSELTSPEAPSDKFLLTWSPQPLLPSPCCPSSALPCSTTCASPGPHQGLSLFSLPLDLGGGCHFATQSASLCLTHKGTSEHLSCEWSNRGKILLTSLTAFESLVFPRLLDYLLLVLPSFVLGFPVLISLLCTDSAQPQFVEINLFQPLW